MDVRGVGHAPRDRGDAFEFPKVAEHFIHETTGSSVTQRAVEATEWTYVWVMSSEEFGRSGRGL